MAESFKHIPALATGRTDRVGANVQNVCHQFESTYRKTEANLSADR